MPSGCGCSRLERRFDSDKYNYTRAYFLEKGRVERIHGWDQNGRADRTRRTLNETEQEVVDPVARSLAKLVSSSSS